MNSKKDDTGVAFGARACLALLLSLFLSLSFKPTRHEIWSSSRSMRCFLRDLAEDRKGQREVSSEMRRSGRRR